MDEQQREQQQRAICELAEKYLDDALAAGKAFTEGLCNWAVNKAEREIGGAA